MLSQLNLAGCAKLVRHPLAGTCLLLLSRALSHRGVGSPGISDQLLLGDVTDGPKTHLNLNVPTDDATGLGTHGQQIHLASAMLDAANREVAASIEPLFYKTFSK